MKKRVVNVMFMDGAGGDDAVPLLVAGDPQESNWDLTLICALDGEGAWGYWTFEATACSVALVCQQDAPQRRYYAAGQQGQIFCSESGQHPWVEVIATAGTKGGGRGYLSRIRAIAGDVYVCGGQGQVYRRIDRDRWETLDRAPLTSKKPGDRILEDIGGFAADDLYVVGDKGRIYHYDGRRWTNVSPGHKVAFTSLRCGEDGQVYVAGDGGLVLAGDKTGWRTLVEDPEIECIWDLEWFKGKLYVVADDRLMRVDGGVLKPVRTGLSPTIDAHRLSASNGLLWSIGEIDIASFDGKTWTRWEHPDNQP